ncbi:hypothetical protein D7B24_002078 [Verticillium nonalfalfae]|uniref:Pathway-specific nitrogen regulator n=1 Tax=Verticillium nonalfalfae TaxID=1051616 RepID=A0A3M9Y043_9PEZI|nr:uncharacterized protein D7B24_002078 [Verticillium nonalfalfae]RNJ53276.1 hypothetical protein D7B24_002078 [Verticillium nonalfalfae]
MPRAGFSDFDFDIHVDPSCLRTPMEDHTPASQDDSYRAEPATPATDGTSHQHEKAGLVASLPHQSQDDSLDMSAHDPSIDTADFADHDDRRVSGRTDALIHAAAQAVVHQIERNRHGETEEEHSVLSSHVNDNDTVEGTEVSYVTETDGDRRDSRDSRNSRGSFVSESQASRHDSDSHDDRAGDSSSHHEADSEVFSDRSARSSLGSFEGSLHNGMKLLKRSQHVDDEDETRTEHSRISDFSHYDPREFQPTLRSTPRPAFHSTSDVRALQMSSPAPSVFGGSPRSSKRPHMPTISRLGSPSMSAQYSPKGRTTPSRLKPRKTTPPLVLLHATLLPLRWPWADVLEAAPSDVLSPEAKTLRDYWRRLHDRLDDTVCDRGVLLPHPQNDFEVLEERLLDALDLPLRRRARILECGHYLGPSNEATLTEDLDSEEEDEPELRSRQSSSLPRKSLHGQTHWCTTCHHEIKFEPLGPGKIFRVKVYASNGLIKAGAWDACWKEMERVDVEIEPIIEGGVLDELERLAIEQREAAEAAEREADEAAAAEAAEAALIESSMMENGYTEHAALPALAMASPLPAISPAEPTPLSSDTVSRHDQLEERRFRDEARMREIYGDTPQPTMSHAGSTEPTPDSYIPGPTPVSPSEEARARREARREAAPPPLQNASLPELLLEAARVMLQDRKNVALVLLTLLVLFLAVKPPVRDDMRMYDWESKIPHNDAGMPEVVEIKTVAAAPAIQPVVEPAVQPVVEPADASSSAVVEPNTAQDPCQTPSAATAADVRPEAGAPVDETVTSREVVRVVETVTETETVKAFVTEEAPSPSTVPTEAAQPAPEEEQVQLEHKDASGSGSSGDAPAASVVDGEDDAEPRLVPEEVEASSLAFEPEVDTEAETGSADDTVKQQRQEEQHGEQDKQEL